MSWEGWASGAVLTWTGGQQHHGSTRGGGLGLGRGAVLLIWA